MKYLIVLFLFGLVVGFINLQVAYFGISEELACLYFLLAWVINEELDS